MTSSDEEPRFPELKAAVADAFRTGFEAIEAAEKDLVPVALSGYSVSNYERVFDSVFEPKKTLGVAFSDYSTVRLSELAAAQVQPAAQYIFDSGHFANIFTGNDPDSNGNSIVDPLEVLDTMFNNYLTCTQFYLRFFEPAFDLVYSEIEAEIASKSIEQVQYVPIIGLELLVDPIALGEGVLVRRMTDDEIGFAIEMSALLTSSVGGGIHVGESSQFAIVFSDQVDYGPAAATDTPSPDMNLIAGRFLSALRVAFGGSVAATRVLTKVRPTILRMPFGAAARARPDAQPNPRRPCVLSSAQSVAAIRRVYELVEIERLDRLSLDIAVSRFRGSALRQSPEDRLIDLVIAAESVCGDDSPTELRFKVGLRMSLMIRGEYPDLDPVELQRFIGAIYDTRSQVVHGGKRSRAQKKVPQYTLLNERTTTSLDESVDQFETLVSSLINAVSK